MVSDQPIGTFLLIKLANRVRGVTCSHSEARTLLVAPIGGQGSVSLREGKASQHRLFRVTALVFVRVLFFLLLFAD